MRILAKKSELQRLRISKGINQTELAHKVGTTSAYMSQIENRLRGPIPGLAKKIADALGVEVFDIFEVEVNQGKPLAIESREQNA